MADDTHGPIPGWRYGVDPQAVGLTIRSLGRADHPLGEALRIELTTSAATALDPVHLQWFVATPVGPWALWTTCAPEEVADCESALRKVTWFAPDASGEPLADVAREGTASPPRG